MSLLRNNKALTLKDNGKNRHGQFAWHDANCQVEDHGMTRNSAGLPSRALWCATHGQWAIETPVKVTYTFEDGVEVTKEL